MGVLKNIKDWWLFTKALWTNPRSIGAFLPSSTYLAKEMARHIQLKPGDVVVELGPGTGVVTAALLQKLSNPGQLVAVEYSSHFAHNLRKRFPEITLIEGNAIDLEVLLSAYKGRVAYIVSSLPLRTLPLSTSLKILEQIEKVLSPGGSYIQFTYGYDYEIFGKLSELNHIYTKRVWLNIPPARVDIWKAP
jgi:phosphatidylethanolamine/phosphatidyl-N-methylethanolamine N-methyltransferase